MIDGGERSCVRLLLELRQHVTRLAPGTVIHLIATDPAAPLDLAAWCHLTGHTYLDPVTGGSPLAYAIRVSETAHATDAANPWRPAG